METEAVQVKRRGRKRKLKVEDSVETDGEVKKRAVDTRSTTKALVGSYVNKKFEGGRVSLGKVVHYDKGLYRIYYENGDCEELESGEVQKFLFGNDGFDGEFLYKKKELDGLVTRKNMKEKNVEFGNAVELTNVVHGAEGSVRSELWNGGRHENVVKVIGDVDADSSSDSCEYAHDGASNFTAKVSLIPPPELPPSTGNIGVPDECVAELLSVYSFLRSFSIRLFLSPFGLEDFVGSLNCAVQNTLLDAIHVALMRALRRHFETMSSDGSELASKCLRSMDWSLIDSLTWPVFVAQYLLMMGYTKGLQWEQFYMNALQKEYYDLSAGKKLMILQILCDDVLDSAELRAETDMRVESEVVIDSDGDIVTASGGGPRRVHPRYSKTSACRDQEAMEILADGHNTKLSSNSSSLSYKSTGIDPSADDQDDNGDECRLCGMDGTLLCCDGCPSVYHSRCIGVSKMFIPEGEWFCPECKVNRIGPKITRGTSLRGAALFGVDPYEQVFLGTCNYLLVMKMSMNSESFIRYYYEKDIPSLLLALHSSMQYATMYSDICKEIVQYWKLPTYVMSLNEKVGLGSKLSSEKQVRECPTPSLALVGKKSHGGFEVPERESFASCITESSSENVAVSCLGYIYDESGNSKTLSDTLTQLEHPSHLERNNESITDLARPLHNVNSSEQINMETIMSSGSASHRVDPSDLAQHKLAGAYASCTSGNKNSNNCTNVNDTCTVANTSCRGKSASRLVGRGGYINLSDCIYVGSSFKTQAYINHYIHGDFSASAAVNLAILLSEENLASKSHDSGNNGKGMSTTLQVKAFSSAAIRFFWPNIEKKLVEVPRERCGWCLSCKAPVQSKKACLLNAAASNAIKGTMKVLTSIPTLKNGEGSLRGIAAYLMFLEESLCGLTDGPFESSAYRKQWCKQVEQAATCNAMKSLLLELEENICLVAFCGDWIKLVDDWCVESSLSQITTTDVGSSQRRGPGRRRGRKQLAVPDVTADDSKMKSNSFIWWRGGIISKLIFMKGILPCSVVKKSARQGGSRKISCINYADGVEVPRRSRRYVWRASVEMSKNTSQLAAQIRYLDKHLRWGDLIRREQGPLEGKGSEIEASAFRNAFICDKQNVENKIRYAVAFGSQKHVPSRIMKNVIEIGKCEDEMEKYWFLESRVPLYMIKEYEVKTEKVPLPSAGKPVKVLSKLQRRQLKASRKDIFSYLSRRRDNLEVCRCASCQLDVFLGNAVNCCRCEGYCHVQCTVSSTVYMNEEVEFLVTCNGCHHNEAITQKENYYLSSTSPLLKKEPQSAPTAIKGVKKNGSNMPEASHGALCRSYEKNSTRNSSSLEPKKRSNCSWGLIWKKKNFTESGIDFRLKNILLKGNPYLSTKVECDLCKKPYNPDLMYICCATCKKWYHADAVELQESQMLELMGFKCCKCRRIKSPVCPYADEVNKVALDGWILRKRVPKQGCPGLDPCPGTTYEQLIERKPATLMLPEKEELVKGGDPSIYSQSTVQHVTGDPSMFSLSRTEPQKIPLRNHMKQRNDNVCSLISNPSVDSSIPSVGNSLPPIDESSSLCVELDISRNDFKDDTMLDKVVDGMDFEPQTYFSITELLASDDSDEQLDDVDPSENVIESFEKTSTLSRNDNPEQHDIGTDKREHTDSLTPAAHVMPCRSCSCTEPSPDLCCQICGVWMHSHCSPWFEESCAQGEWRCINCQEWR